MGVASKEDGCSAWAMRFISRRALPASEGQYLLGRLISMGVANFVFESDSEDAPPADELEGSSIESWCFGDEDLTRFLAASSVGGWSEMGAVCGTL